MNKRVCDLKVHIESEKKTTWGKSTNETYQHLQGLQIKGLSTDYNRYKTEPKALKTQ